MFERRISLLVDSEHCAQLREHCRLELNTTIGVQLFRDAIFRNPLGVTARATVGADWSAIGTASAQPVKISIIVKTYFGDAPSKSEP